MTATRAALGSAVLAAVVVATAPAMPDAVRSLMIVAALVAWASGVGWAVVAAARQQVRQPLAPFSAIGLAGIGLAVVATTQLELIRLFGGHAALTWNVDWRFALGHAQAIARTGGLGSALDYAGVPIRYHVGPAWFAGAATHALRLDLGIVRKLFERTVHEVVELLAQDVDVAAAGADALADVAVVQQGVEKMFERHVFVAALQRFIQGELKRLL